jgi:two-component system sensor histidine kinase KdpD
MAAAAAIDRETEHLNRMVTNLLDLGRIEAGALIAEREALDVEEVIRSSIDRYRPRLEPRTVEVAVPDDLPPVFADPVFTGQVLANLLDNAASFVPADGTVRVEATTADGMIRIRVADTGPGVPDDAIERLFEKFYRAGRPGARPGTGTGLAVVRGLTEAMGGRVAAEPSAMGGLAVDVFLPAAPARPPDDDHG